MLIKLGDQIFNTDFLINAYFSPEGNDTARLSLTFAVPSGGSLYTGMPEHDTLDFNGDKAMALWKFLSSKAEEIPL